MSSSDFEHEPTIPNEDVERRREPRGLLDGTAVVMPDGQRYGVVEASRKSLFATVDDPEVFRLGDEHDATVEIADERVACRVEVVRKEIHPRRGIALRIVRIGAVAEETLRALLEGTEVEVEV